MPSLVKNNTPLQCSFGTAPSGLGVVSTSSSEGADDKLATVQDYAPNTCIRPFGPCTSPTNPQGMGKPPPAVPAPCPCVPITTSPWSGGSTSIEVEGKKALLSTSTLSCQWGGTISVAGPPIMVDGR